MKERETVLFVFLFFRDMLKKRFGIRLRQKLHRRLSSRIISGSDM